MATFRRRRCDGKVQEWAKRTWNATESKWESDYRWSDAPHDAPERFMETRNPEIEGMCLVPVDDFDNDGPIVFDIVEFIAMLEEQESKAQAAAAT